jgi:hypothetical protein
LVANSWIRLGQNEEVVNKIIASGEGKELCNQVLTAEVAAVSISSTQATIERALVIVFLAG